MSEPFIGEIRLFAFNRTITGWQVCDGSLLSIAQFDALFAAIGTTYGGDGQNVFAVPDLRGRVPICYGSGQGMSTHALGEKAGSEAVTLQANDLPAHSHSFHATAADASTPTPAAGLQLGKLVGGDTMYATDVTGLNPIPAGDASVGKTGTGLPHDNLMPTLTLSFFIATEGIFPSQN